MNTDKATEPLHSGAKSQHSKSLCPFRSLHSLLPLPIPHIHLDVKVHTHSLLSAMGNLQPMSLIWSVRSTHMACETILAQATHTTWCYVKSGLQAPLWLLSACITIRWCLAPAKCCVFAYVVLFQTVQGKENMSVDWLTPTCQIWPKGCSGKR